MTPETEKQKPQPGNPFDKVFGHRQSSTALDWAVLGCLAAGAVGIIKALEMETPTGVLLCLLGAVTAFGLVIYVHRPKS